VHEPRSRIGGERWDYTKRSSRFGLIPMDRAPENTGRMPAPETTNLAGDDAATVRMFEEHLPFARAIAAGFTFQGNLDPDEVRSEAQRALWRAAQGFDPSRGGFKPYAGQAVRNALRSLHRAVRTDGQRMLPLDAIGGQGATSDSEAGVGFQISDESADTLLAVCRRDRQAFVKDLLEVCSPAETEAVRRYADGESFQDIADAMGISKTMAHKHCQAAFARMREKAQARQVTSTQLCAQTDPNFRNRVAMNDARLFSIPPDTPPRSIFAQLFDLLCDCFRRK
jgi:RNA polymerase sigma factor (sigma-70 family)